MSVELNRSDEDALNRDVEWISETMGPEYLAMNIISGSVNHLLSMHLQEGAIVLWAWLYTVSCETEEVWLYATVEALAKERNKSVKTICRYLKCLSHVGYFTVDDSAAKGIKIMAVIPDEVLVGIVARTKENLIHRLETHMTQDDSEKYFVRAFGRNREGVH